MCFSMDVNSLEKVEIIIRSMYMSSINVYQVNQVMIVLLSQHLCQKWEESN